MTITAATLDRSQDDYDHTARVARHRAAFKNIETIRLPVMNNFVKEMDILRQACLLQAPGSPRDGMCVRLPSGVGKTTAARTLLQSVAERAGVPVEQSPVLLVTLDVEDTISVWSAILRALGDPYWDLGYPKQLIKRALKILAKRRIEMIIIDEFNHSVDRGQARLLMNTVKELLNAGVAPVVVMGTDEEIEKLPKNQAFERRMVHAPRLGPLRWEDEAGKLNWRGFLQGLDQGIVKAEILPARSGLGGKKLAEALCDDCDGIIGYAHWVVQDALNDVLKRNGSSIERLDIAVSVDRLYVKFEIFDRVNSVQALS